jgi:hypothetical protein
MCSTYAPGNMPEIRIEFIQTEPGIAATAWTPEMYPEVEIVDLTINDFPISDDLAAHLLETLGDTWEAEIVQRLRGKRERRFA